MAHAQKPDFVFRRSGRFHLNRQGTSVQSTTGSRGVRICGSNAGYTMFRGSVKGTVPTPFASFRFTTPPVRHRVPSRFNWALALVTFVWEIYVSRLGPTAGCTHWLFLLVILPVVVTYDKPVTVSVRHESIFWCKTVNEFFEFQQVVLLFMLLRTFLIFWWRLAKRPKQVAISFILKYIS